MKRLRIADFLNQSAPERLGHLIYLIRDGDTIFYVGQSRRDLLTRFREHLGAPSRLGRFILANTPQSDQWTVELYTLQDCRPFVPQPSLFALQEWEHFDMDMAEKEMIRRLRPVLNRDFNPQPRPLPSHYRGQEIVNEEVEETASFQSAAQRIWRNRLQLQGWVRVTPPHGRPYWEHRSGQTLSETKMEQFRQAGTFPPVPR